MNAIRKMFGAMVLACAALTCSGSLNASPLDDLSSPSQERRDAAAKTQRETYKPPTGTNYDALVKTLKLGATRAVIETRLRSSNLAAGGDIGSGTTLLRSYRLDDLWVLECSFTNGTLSATNGGLAQVALAERLRDVWVEPPTNFTGVWRTYWLNGQPSHEFHYKDGHQEGLLTTFYRDGAKSGVSPLHNGVPDGEGIGFYPSGKIRHKGTYRAGSPVGTWVWYKEDGSVESKQDHTKK